MLSNALEKSIKVDTVCFPLMWLLYYQGKWFNQDYYIYHEGKWLKQVQLHGFFDKQIDVY